jgi:hypothetical protein
MILKRLGTLQGSDAKNRINEALVSGAPMTSSLRSSCGLRSAVAVKGELIECYQALHPLPLPEQLRQRDLFAH